ncbi:dynein intermediate chain 3, ciliary [Trichonephila clavata]|uniref:Dynein intermediate chain 3, ciliary n=1 Tax=Trichonephila clavata TaxID=2740835 RepID=A0A8X6LTD2_TRICU|nr:dynein intermediate chain 3, ciliary [Trichonephila clavata]
MDLTYVYNQKRRRFGAKCNFTNVGPYLSVDIEPDPKLKEQFMQVSSADKETQCSQDMSLHTANTVLLPTSVCGVNHQVGGWPPDVDPRDEDQVARFKKKIQKDENFVGSIKVLSDLVENFIMENNSVDIYEEYFADDSFKQDQGAEFKTLSVYRDSCDVKREIRNLSWALDGGKIAAAYRANLSANSIDNLYCHSYVWDIENSNTPYCILMPDAPINCVEYSPRDLELLVGGWSNGQIGLWDVRAGGRPQQLSTITQCHKEGVSDIKWISSKTGFEFFSGSTDGRLFCWDSRNMLKPLQSLYFDQNPESSEFNSKYSITCIEYDPTLPHRFMLGTEQGMMLSCNRKFKDQSEIISGTYNTRMGPVLTIQRNSFFPKLFASCSTWGVKVWSEDLTSSPMLNLTSTDGYVTDVAWSNSHASFLFITKSKGNLELWDVLVKTQDPIFSFKLESDGLICVSPKQQDDQIACGTANGCIHLLEVPQYTTFSSKHEKNLVASMVDREGRREKLLEGMNREQRIREKHSEQKEDTESTPMEEDNFYCLEDDKNINTEDEFNSQFDSYDKLIDEELDETVPEMPFFDSQFTDTLKSVLQK